MVSVATIFYRRIGNIIRGVTGNLAGGYDTWLTRLKRLPRQKSYLENRAYRNGWRRRQAHRLGWLISG